MTSDLRRGLAKRKSRKPTASRSAATSGVRGRATWPPVPRASVRPSGLKAKRLDGLIVVAAKIVETLPGCRIPDGDVLSFSARQAPAVGTECQALDLPVRLRHRQPPDVGHRSQ